MSVKLFCKKLSLILPLCLLPGWAFALVYENGVISGMEPNTVVELAFPSGETSSAMANDEGEVLVTREENDDPAGLNIPPGTDGPGELKKRPGGDTIGNLIISDYSIRVDWLAPCRSDHSILDNDPRVVFGPGDSDNPSVFGINGIFAT